MITVVVSETAEKKLLLLLLRILIIATITVTIMIMMLNTSPGSPARHHYNNHDPNHDVQYRALPRM